MVWRSGAFLSADGGMGSSDRYIYCSRHFSFRSIMRLVYWRRHSQAKRKFLIDPKPIFTGRRDVEVLAAPASEGLRQVIEKLIP
jgi:hypothetical protein